VSEDRHVAAEREYQRRLSALHAARAWLAEVEAGQRRLAIDRPRLGAGVAAERADELAAQWARATAAVDKMHDDAVSARAELRHFGEDVEPDALPDEPPAIGFQQPPFQES
jgi:hypothetical protein